MRRIRFWVVGLALLVRATLRYALLGPMLPRWTLGFTLAREWIRHVLTDGAKGGVQYLRARRADMQLNSNTTGINVADNLYATHRDLASRVPNWTTLKPLFSTTGQEGDDHRIPSEWVVSVAAQTDIRIHMSAHASPTTNTHHGHCNRIDAWGHNGPLYPNERVILYLHGGAYVLGSFSGHRHLTCRVSKATQLRVYAIDYRLAPEHPFPCALIDTLYAYRVLTAPPEEGGYGFRPQDVIISGDSAGGGLALAALLYLRDCHQPMPSGAILLSPWVDLHHTAPSQTANLVFDYLTRAEEEHSLDNPAILYATPDGTVQGALPRLNHPYISPTYGNLHGLPPLLIQAGTAELLVDDIATFVDKCTKVADLQVTYTAYPDMIHVFQAFWVFNLPAHTAAFAEISRFAQTLKASTKLPKD
ncbi:hypothetical protein H4R34_002337 [Dimargaris verticillata]|uniref:Alpha/beta hydrolase fold-3 domain-containing protein n=1 Tax=Dimargaris verticillata TaxID=2761393 RepID=A0A9W8B4C8_9FUNG|nr:hypothetical protein H4R34_002337 [Dimargaris verticillata]